jgi:hypothetical protein
MIMSRQVYCVSLLTLAFLMPCMVVGRPQWATDALSGATSRWRHDLRARSHARVRDSLSSRIMHIVGGVRAIKVVRPAEDWYGRGRQRALVDGQ